MKDNYNYVILVDRQDKQIGVDEKMAAHQQGLLHRAFSIFIYRNKNNAYELLLQQRAKNKYHTQGLWSNSCCSHPAPGETIIDAANRRLSDELNLSASMNIVGSFLYKSKLDDGLIEHEYDYILNAVIDDQVIRFNPDEVAATKWVRVDQLMMLLNKQPQQYTPWFKQALAISLASLQ